MLHNKYVNLLLLLASGCMLITAAQIDVNLSKADAELSPVDLHPPPETSSSTTTTTIKPSTSSSTSTTTTSTSTTTTTTPAPITTTTAAPTPTPVPQPTVGTWNSSCIMVTMAAQLNFTYKTKNETMAHTLYNVPSDATVEDAHCENITQLLQINWGPKDAISSLLFQFNQENKTVNMTMFRFVVALTNDKVPDAADNQTIQLIHRQSEFSVPTQRSYHCTRQQRFNMTEIIPDTNITGTVVLSHVQVEAFRNNKNKQFSQAIDCDSSHLSDLVPIAIGIALIALIVIVLTAYLCARRRSTTRGYMSF